MFGRAKGLSFLSDGRLGSPPFRIGGPAGELERIACPGEGFPAG